MDFTLKNLEIKSTTAKITVDRLNHKSNNEQDLKALAILLGGYNQYGRNIDLDTHRENIIAFKDLIDKVGCEL